MFTNEDLDQLKRAHDMQVMGFPKTWEKYKVSALIERLEAAECYIQILELPYTKKQKKTAFLNWRKSGWGFPRT